MDSTKTSLLFLYSLSLCTLAVFQQNYPWVNCPDIFQYKYDQNTGGYYGEVTVEKDGSKTSELQVNMSMKTQTPVKTNIKIIVLTKRDAIFFGNNIQYAIQFPLQNVLPKLTLIQFNGKELCRGDPDPLEPGYIQTSMWAKSIITTFTEPIQTQPAPPDPINSVENPQFFFNFGAQPNNNLFGGMENPFIPVLNNKDGPKPQLTQPPQPTRQPQPAQQPQPTRPPQPAQQPQPTRPPQPPQTPMEPPITSPSVTSKPLVTTPTKRLDQCGMVSPGVNLILGGDDVAPGDYPWLAAIMHSQGADYRFHCAGNLLSDRHVLTAGHCVRYYNAPLYDNDELIVVLGKTNIVNWASGGVLKSPKTITAHPNYKQNNPDYDVAIILLDEPVRFRPTVRPICLWDGRDDLEDIVGRIGTVVGWSKGPDSEMSTIAQKIEMPVVSQETCLRSNKVFKKYTSNKTFCAGNRDSTSGPCIGDSGAGFMIRDSKSRKWYLRGLVGFSIRDPEIQDAVTCDLKNYAVFMDVAKIRSWIQEEMSRD